jgi:ribosomal protein L3
VVRNRATTKGREKDGEWKPWGRQRQRGGGGGAMEARSCIIIGLEWMPTVVVAMALRDEGLM